MDNRFLKCALVGGVIIFAWGIISWMLFPWHQQSLKQFKNENAVYNAIKDNAPESGIYILPNMYVYRSGMSQGDLNRQVSVQHQMMEKGPVMFASVSREGVGGMRYIPFVTALLIGIVGAGIITWMLFQTKLTMFRDKVIFVTVAGLLVAILGSLPSWNWWGFSAAYTLGCMADVIIGWFFAGIAISRLSKK